MPSDISVSSMPRTQLKFNIYNMNSGLLPQSEVAAGGATPRTPEILNSLIAMTNPFDRSLQVPRVASSPPTETESTSGSFPCSVSSPPSVQHTCSQLIKEGLKLTIQSKRRSHTSMSSPGPEMNIKSSSNEQLTPEDEERRRRRRERNKIAATKCRLKKREKTVNLVQESEILETQNLDLKTQIKNLEDEKKRLVDMLTLHRPSCVKQQYMSVMSPTSNYEGSPYPQTQRSSSSSVETSPVSYSSYPSPYCKVEMSMEAYKASSEPTYTTVDSVEEISYTRSLTTTYHNFDQPQEPFLRHDYGLTVETGGYQNNESPRNYSPPEYKPKDLLPMTNFYEEDNFTSGYSSGSCIS